MKIVTYEQRTVGQVKTSCAERVADPLLSQAIANLMSDVPFREIPNKVTVTKDNFSQLPPKVKAYIREVLKDAAKVYNCRVEDLIWRMKKGIIHVKKRSEPIVV